MSTTLKRTSMALDAETLDALDYLAKQWDTSKAAVIRRCVRDHQEEEQHYLPSTRKISHVSPRTA